MVMSPNISELLYFAARFNLSSNINNRCLLYFNADTMCSFTKKLQLLGNEAPRHPTGAPPLDPAGDFRPSDPQSSFMSLPNNHVRSTPLSAQTNKHTYSSQYFTHIMQMALLHSISKRPCKD